jgi:glycosyltransferase involved in cell wall biosynthesis
MKNEALASVLINNYNYGKFLNDAIDSTLDQTYSRIEVIVVDDGSTDDSHEIIKSYGNRIQSIFQPNRGQASAFNVGFAKSQGDIIFFLDSDDIFLPNKIEAIVNIFNQNPDIGWCFHPLRLIDNGHQTLHTEVYNGTSGVYDIREHIKRGKLRGKLPMNGTATSGMCFKRAFLSRILPMPEEIRITSDDYIKYAAFGLDKGFITLQEYSLQRIHGNNAYTLQPQKKQLISEVEILTAYWLKHNFPELEKFANNIFALGLGTYSKHHSEGIETVIRDYLHSLEISRQLEVRFRKLLYSFYIRLNLQ